LPKHAAAIEAIRRQIKTIAFRVSTPSRADAFAWRTAFGAPRRTATRICPHRCVTPHGTSVRGYGAVYDRGLADYPHAKNCSKKRKKLLKAIEELQKTD